MTLGPLNLVLRGHVRSSFDDGRLRDLVRSISEIFDVGIYVQTWSVVQNSLSWRGLSDIPKEVDEGTVRDYMESDRIKCVKILDDSKIKHVGSVEGKIGRTPCPVLAWKNMYYGMVVASKAVFDAESPTSVTAQMRLDILSNPFSPPHAEVVSFLQRDYGVLAGGQQGDERMRFLRMRCFMGVDNIYMSTTEDMYRFVSYMYYDMDRIIHFHRKTIHQEHIAFHERKSFLRWDMSRNSVV